MVDTTTPIQSQTHHIEIKPAYGWAMLDLEDLWHFCDLLVILMMRDVKLRCRQTALGAVWVILQSLIAMTITDGFRLALLRVGKFPVISLTLSLMMAILLFAAGGLVFQRVGQNFADVI